MCVCVCVCAIYFSGLNLRILNAWRWSARPQHVAYIDETKNLCCGWRQYVYQYLICLQNYLFSVTHPVHLGLQSSHLFWYFATRITQAFRLPVLEASPISSSLFGLTNSKFISLSVYIIEIFVLQCTTSPCLKAPSRVSQSQIGLSELWRHLTSSDTNNVFLCGWSSN